MAQTYKTILFFGGDSFFVRVISFLCRGGRCWNDSNDLSIFTVLPSYRALSVTVDGWVDTADRFSFLSPLGSFTLPPAGPEALPPLFFIKVISLTVAMEKKMKLRPWWWQSSVCTSGIPRVPAQHMIVIRQGTVSSTKNCSKIEESLRVCLLSEQDIRWYFQACTHDFPNPVPHTCPTSAHSITLLNPASYFPHCGPVLSPSTTSPNMSSTTQSPHFLP